MESFDFNDVCSSRFHHGLAAFVRVSRACPSHYAVADRVSAVCVLVVHDQRLSSKRLDEERLASSFASWNLQLCQYKINYEIKISMRIFANYLPKYKSSVYLLTIYTILITFYYSILLYVSIKRSSVGKPRCGQRWNSQI